MEQMLDALEYVQRAYREAVGLHNSSHDDCYTVKAHNAGAALRAALAEPEPFQPDWVNYRQGVADGKREALANLAETAVPVAWMEQDWNGTGYRRLSWTGPPSEPSVRDELVQPVWTPLFAAPQPPAPAVDYKPLTDPHDHPEPHSYKWTQSEMGYINKRVAAAIAAHEAKRGKA
jgi:hypothetical protein